MQQRNIRLIHSVIEKWKEKNREHLPINIDQFQIRISPSYPMQENEQVSLGKFISSKPFSGVFYKPYSKILLPDE